MAILYFSDHSLVWSRSVSVIGLPDFTLPMQYLYDYYKCPLWHRWVVKHIYKHAFQNVLCANFLKAKIVSWSRIFVVYMAKRGMQKRGVVTPQQVIKELRISLFFQWSPPPPLISFFLSCLTKTIFQLTSYKNEIWKMLEFATFFWLKLTVFKNGFKNALATWMLLNRRLEALRLDLNCQFRDAFSPHLPLASPSATISKDEYCTSSYCGKRSRFLTLLLALTWPPFSIGFLGEIYRCVS